MSAPLPIFTSVQPIIICAVRNPLFYASLKCATYYYLHLPTVHLSTVHPPLPYILHLWASLLHFPFVLTESPKLLLSHLTLVGKQTQIGGTVAT